MKKNRAFFFPLHLDSGNRGCEAIARGTIEILDLDVDEYFAFPKNKEADEVTQLNKLISYYEYRQSVIKKLLFRVIRKLTRKTENKITLEYKYRYRGFLKRMRKTDKLFITGGDMLCYGDNEIGYLTDYAKAKHIQSVLWGCSFGEENWSVSKYEALKKIDVITVRESLTYDYLVRELKLTNVKLFSDPAFVLKPQAFDLPEYFERDCIGINLSNFVGADISKDTRFGRNIIKLLDYLSSDANYNIVFFPHVFWEGQDDRESCAYYYNLYKDLGRMYMLDTEKLNYCQIRYAISKCKFFIGARTHAMISAYSTCVPSIALGYSIKSRGIAKDLGLPNYAVQDYRNLVDDEDLLRAFLMLQENEEVIKGILKDKISDYIDLSYRSRISVDNV